KAKVIRDGKEIEIAAIELVPGDIILLEEGDNIPADARLIEVANLRVNEAAVTGESLPVDKSLEELKDVLLPDRTNMVYSGTAVISGRGKAVVVGTGMSTEMGRIAGLVQVREAITPLQIKLGNLGKLLGVAVVAIVAAIMAIGLARGMPVVDMFLVAVSLAVAAVPEGLPAILTISLATAAQRMARKHAIVRRMAAVESLGSSTVICSDKTGTLTTGEMTVTAMWTGTFVDITGIGFEPVGEFWTTETVDGKTMVAPYFPTVEQAGRRLLEAAVACNNARIEETPTGWSVVGDPTEGALLIAAMKAFGELPKQKRIAEIAFSSERKRMTVVTLSPSGAVLNTKGAPETLLKLCTTIFSNGQVVPLTSEKIAEVRAAGEVLAARGLRTLAFAYKEMPVKSKYSEDDEKEMTFLGFMGIMDPPRPEIPAAISMCDRAGIRTVMITGDHAMTAGAIAREIGLVEEGSEVLTGAELEKMSDSELIRKVEKIHVYARAAPEHKMRILKAFKARGEVVAMTGDGVNDAPALKASDVGVSMGLKGTDVAKESSDIVLTDDNFATIVTAIEEGRRVYDNIRKFMRFMLSTNFTEIIMVSTAIFGGLPLPLLPLQILWLNLVTDTFPSLALSLDPVEPGIMARKPRSPKSGILSGMTAFIVTGAVLAATIALTAFWWELTATGDLAKAQTMAFTTMCLFELLFVFNCRSEKYSVWKTGPLENRWLFIGVIMGICLQLAVIYVPVLQNVFGTTALGLEDWTKIIPLALPALLVVPEIFIREAKEIRKIEFEAKKIEKEAVKVEKKAMKLGKRVEKEVRPRRSARRPPLQT
ncbi:MAG: HAD-IC family P-type ATPase, partial [Candidatus Aenigmatarchaeota archaeon]